ncbi:alpha/beta hydrolase [Microbacterium pumilum]|uniref:alpha/beta fold hydrolase n=1 Tax=Microbacterium pumilum TaxID=344165 RepID=UPI0031DCB22F
MRRYDEQSEATMPGITTSDGVRLTYLESGDAAGRPVMLIAGFKAAATSWRPQLAALEKAGHRVIAFNRRGHGDSEVGPDGSHTMDRHGADVGDAIRELGLEDVTLIGQSMGGNSIWALLSNGGAAGIRDIVIVDQTPKMLNSDDWAYGFYDYDSSNVDTFFATGIPDPARHPLVSKGPVRIGRLLKAMDLKAAKAGFTSAELELLGDHARRDWRPAIAATQVPVLFVAGRESEFWPCEHAAAAASLAPRGTSAVIRKAGHATNLEQPKAFNDGVLAWLSAPPLVEEAGEGRRFQSPSSE